MARPSVRGKLVEAALQVLHEQGFNGSSIQDITDAAGVPKGSFMNHFKSKEALAIEVLNPYGESNRGDMLFDKSKAPLDRLRSHFEFMTARYVGFGFARSCLFADFASEMGSSHPQMRDALKTIFDQWSGAIAALLREAQETGEIDPRLDADQLGGFLVNAWEGVVMRMKVERSRTPADQFLDTTFRLLLR